MQVSTVFFDMGGVLTPDPYETVLLHGERGLGRTVGLTPEDLTERIGDIWIKYATLPASLESDFWHEVTEGLGLEIEQAEIEQVRLEVITPNPEAEAAFRFLQERGIRIGVISDNTAFLYPFQANLLSLSHYAAEELIFLSHEQKLTKAGGLFELAARIVGTDSALVVDDRPANIKRAQASGFRTLHYASQRQSLLATLAKSLEL